MTRALVRRGVTEKTIGTGLSKKRARSVDMNTADPQTIHDFFAEMNEAKSWLWDGMLRNWRDLLDDELLPLAQICPGKNDLRCCGWWILDEADEATLERYADNQLKGIRKETPDATDDRGRSAIDSVRAMGCWGAKWIELDDLEWHIRDADLLYSLLAKAVAENDVNEAAVHGVKLGQRLDQLAIKLSAEQDFLHGRETREGRARGGAASRKRSDQSRIYAVWQKLKKNPQLSKSEACRLTALEFGESLTTIRRALHKRVQPKI